MTWLRSLGFAAIFGGLLGASACDPSNPNWGGKEGDGDGDSGNPNPDAWMKLGQGETEFQEVKDGDELLMVLGGQGLLMFPMPLHASGFTLPDDPSDYTDPRVPVLDMHLDIEGFNTGFGGHFARIANYPIPFEVLEDGTYEFIYVTIFVPDDLANPCDIDELPGTIHAELETADGDLLSLDLEVSIEVPEVLGEGCTP
ncbi:hypothetical protein ACNOYE_11625 [Nannocystaceae bacterium ST9]